MANYIDFPEEVSRYYSQEYRKKNPYADVLSSLVRSYSGINTQIDAMNLETQQLTRASSQRSIADIHSAFEQGRRGLAGAGYSGAFSRVTGRTLQSGQQETIRQATQEGESSIPQVEKVDMSEDPFYRAYIADTQSRIESTAGLSKNLFAYLNTSDTLSDIDFAIEQGYINPDGSVTEKGKLVMGYYTSQIEINDAEITDELVANKGTFKRYVQDLMGDKYDEGLLGESLDAFSKMTGAKLGERTFLTTEERNKMFEGGDARFAKEDVDFEKDSQYRTIKDKNAPDLSQTVTAKSGEKYTIDEMIKFGLAEGLRAIDKKGRNVYYHDGQWYLDKKDRRTATGGTPSDWLSGGTITTV